MSLYFDNYPVPIISVYGCTVKDHSDYIEDTNHYNTLTLGKEKTFCNKCNRPNYRTWYQSIEWNNKDKAYWKGLFKSIWKWIDLPYWRKFGPGNVYVYGNPDGPEGSVWDDVRKGCKELYRAPKALTNEILLDRYHRRLTPPKEHNYFGYQTLINLKLNMLTEDQSCVDNHRWAALDSRADMRRYRRQRDKGCCGSHDEEISILGRKFMIGWNYGH